MDFPLERCKYYTIDELDPNKSLMACLYNVDNVAVSIQREMPPHNKAMRPSNEPGIYYIPSE